MHKTETDEFKGEALVCVSVFFICRVTIYANVIADIKASSMCPFSLIIQRSDQHSPILV